MRYAIQKLIMSPLGRKQHLKPEIRYYESDSIKDAENMNRKEHGIDWKYVVIKPVFEIGDYIGDNNDVCYLVKAVSDEMITIYNPITNKEYTDYVDYERWHILRKSNHEDVTNYPIGSQWRCSKESGLVNSQDVVTITDYALSDGTFWVRCERNKFYRFIARDCDLYKESKDFI